LANKALAHGPEASLQRARPVPHRRQQDHGGVGWRRRARDPGRFWRVYARLDGGKYGPRSV